jgi:hypothetical protein
MHLVDRDLVGGVARFEQLTANVLHHLPLLAALPRNRHHLENPVDSGLAIEGKHLGGTRHGNSRLSNPGREGETG